MPHIYPSLCFDQHKKEVIFQFVFSLERYSEDRTNIEEADCHEEMGVYNSIRNVNE